MLNFFQAKNKQDDEKSRIGWWYKLGIHDGLL